MSAQSPYPEVASLIRANRDGLVVEWIERLKREVPAAEKHSFDELCGSVPLFIDSLATTLASGQPANVEEVGKSFAESRYQLGNYTPLEMLYEFNIMRQVVFDFLDSVKPFPVEARNLILDVLFSVYNIAGDCFGEAMRRKERDISQQLREERDLREQFVALLSHDFLNALTVAHANARLADRAGDDNKRSLFSGRVIEAIKRAERMARDVLDANAIHAGERLRLNPEEFDMMSLLQELVLEYTSSHGSRFQTRGQPMTGFWSRSHIRRAVENLINNAIKYGNENAPISITLDATDAQAQISVHNAGELLSELEQKAIFKQFHRTLAAQKSKQHGWGLGLTLVTGIAEAHGGCVRVSSTSEAGTVFTIVLPRDARPFGPK